MTVVRMPLLFFLFIQLCFSLTAHADASVTLSGTVKDAKSGETIIVSGQVSGQNAAISQQLSALPVMNVVSAAKTLELPDMTAADAVGRLPGVALIRVGGDGTRSSSVAWPRSTAR